MSCTCLCVERVDVDAAHVAVHADHRRQAGRQVQVGGLVLDRKREQLGDVHGSSGVAPARGGMVAAPDGAAVTQMIADKLARVNERIASACAGAGRPVQSVTLLAVSKTSPAALPCARRIAAGQRDFGENYVQEALDKIDALADLRGAARVAPDRPAAEQQDARVVAEHFDWVHSVDRAEDRRAPDRRSGRADLRAAAGLPAGQHQRRGEQERRGAGARRWRSRARSAALPRLQLRGLMAIPEPAGDFDGAARAASRAAPSCSRRCAATGLGARHACRWA